MTDLLTPENIGKLVALFVSVISAYKAFSELVSKKKGKLRADYEFAEKFIADEKWEKLHDYLLERGYWGLSGRQLEASIIRYFLRLKDPLGQLTDYTPGLRFLSPLRNDKGAVSSIEYKSKLNVTSKFKWKNRRIMTGYFVFAFLSLGPVIFIGNFIAQGFAGMSALIAWVVSFGMLAYLNLNEIWALQSAKRIVEGAANNQFNKDSGADAPSPVS